MAGHFVTDSATVLCWVRGSRVAIAERALDALYDGRATVHAHWPLEIAAGLHQALQAGVAVAEVEFFGQRLQRLPIAVDWQGQARWFDAIPRLAVETGLTIAQAATLDLALREGLPLLSVSEELMAVSKQKGVQEVCSE